MRIEGEIRSDSRGRCIYVSWRNEARSATIHIGRYYHKEEGSLEIRARHFNYRICVRLFLLISFWGKVVVDLHGL